MKTHSIRHLVSFRDVGRPIAMIRVLDTNKSQYGPIASSFRRRLDRRIIFSGKSSFAFHQNMVNSSCPRKGSRGGNDTTQPGDVSPPVSPRPHGRPVSHRELGDHPTTSLSHLNGPDSFRGDCTPCMRAGQARASSGASRRFIHRRSTRSNAWSGAIFMDF
jgi:hypothetical protein